MLALADAAGATRHGIRRLCAEDLPEVAALRRRTFPRSEQPDQAHLVAYLERMLLRAPGRDDDLTSLVYEDDAGRIVGFIGVIPRRMIFRDETIRVAVATQMMVAPEARGLAGRELVRAVLEGPQGLTITDTANEAARRVWKSVGANESVMHGFTWERVLRPLQSLRARHAQSPTAFRVAARATLPLLRAGDALVGRHSRFAPPQPKGTLDWFEPTQMAAAAETMLAESELHPAYDAETLTGLLDDAMQKRSLGHLCGGVVREPSGAIAGWIAHYVTPRGISHVVQVVAPLRTRRLVMDHLVLDAWRQGAIAVSGRMDTTMLPLVEDPRYIVRRQAPWTLYHSGRDEITRAMETGAFFSRLDGEYWLRF